MLKFFILPNYSGSPNNPESPLFEYSLHEKTKKNRIGYGKTKLALFMHRA